MKSVRISSHQTQAKKRAENTAGSTSGWLPKVLSAATLALACTLTACSHDYTLAWVYAPSASLSSGLINAYRVDYQTGELTLLPDSPIPSGGRKPAGLVATPANQDVPAIFVINHDDSNIVSFLVGTDGKLYPHATYDTFPGTSFPTSLAISPDGKYLYVAYTYQAGYTNASPGPGGISVYPITTSGNARELGTPVDFHLGRAPVAVTVGNGGNTVYVLAQDAAAVNSASTSTADSTLNLFAFAFTPNSDGTGSLTPLAGQQIVSGNQPSFGFPTGGKPASLIADASGTHLYVTDASSSTVISYSTPSTGVPAQIASGAVPTGGGPGGMAFDPTGKLFFVANYDGTIGEYTFAANGVPVPSSIAASTGAGNGTTCVTVEPTRGIYVYASGSLSNNVTGEQLDPATGALRPIFHSPYEAATLPVCAVTVPRLKLGS